MIPSLPLAFMPFCRLCITFFCLPCCFQPLSTCWCLAPTLTCLLAPSPCLLFHPQSFLAPPIQNKYFNIYPVSEQMCACLLPTIQKGVCVLITCVLSLTTASSVLELAFWELTACLPEHDSFLAEEQDGKMQSNSVASL